MLVYGQSGTGKTTFWATFPGPILCLLCSGGAKPGELRSINTAEYRKKVKPRVIASVREYLDTLDAEADGYATVVVDHATGLADLVLREVVGKDVPLQKGWGLASQQQYGQQAAQLKELFLRTLNLPGNAVIVCQERTFNGGDDSAGSDVLRPVVGAAMSPSVTGWLNQACDYVVQTFKRPRMDSKTVTVAGKSVTRYERGKGVEYCLRTEPHDVYTTKFRRPRGGDELPECIVDPTYEKLVGLVGGS